MSTVAATEREQLQRDLFDAASGLLTSSKTRETLLRSGASDRFPDATWSAVIRAGWAQTLLPAEHGGLDLGLPELGAIFRAVGRGLCRGPLHDLLVTVPMLVREGSDATRDRLLEATTRALVVTAEAPDAPYGRGPAAVTLRGGRLEGEVELVPFADVADRFVVVAWDGTHPAYVLVERQDARVERTPSHDPCVDRGRVALRGVAVGPGDVVVGGASAADLRPRIRAVLRLMVAAELSGVAAAITDMAVEYTKVREQFGRPIAGFQAVRHMVARMTAKAVSLANLTDACLADAEAGPARLAEVASVAKAYATSVGRYVAEEGLQVHGGIGFTAEHPLHLYMRRALTLEGLTGESSDVLADLGRSALAE